MISHYYLCYNESGETLIERINTNKLIDTLDSNIDAENDIFLIHIICDICTNNGIYRKSELRQCIWDMLSKKCIVDTEFPYSRRMENYKSGFNNLFDYCWKQKLMFANSTKKYSVAKVAYTHRPLIRKLIDNNFVFFGSIIIFFFLLYFIDGIILDKDMWGYQGISIRSFPVMTTIGFMYVAAIIAGIGRKQLYHIPLYVLGFYMAYALMSVFGEPDNFVAGQWLEYDVDIEDINIFKIQVVKRNIYLGLSCLLLVPVAILNQERLDDFSGLNSNK